MKKGICAILLLAVLLGLCACGSEKSNAFYEAKIEALEQRIEELEGMLAGSIPVGDNTTQQKPSKATAITLGQKVIIEDIVEFTVHSCVWEDQILPSNTEGLYTYKGDKVDETYLVLRGSLTNLNGNSFEMDDIQDSEILVNGKYSFHVYMEGEDADGKGFGDPTKPLQTVNLVIYASVSDGVKDIFKNATITLNILNDPNRTKYLFDENDECKNSYTIELSQTAFQ